MLDFEKLQDRVRNLANDEPDEEDSVEKEGDQVSLAKFLLLMFCICWSEYVPAKKFLRCLIIFLSSPR